MILEHVLDPLCEAAGCTPQDAGCLCNVQLVMPNAYAMQLSCLTCQEQPDTRCLNEVGCMQGISSTDNRSEVRNCAVRTLFAVVVSQGNRMSSELWDECLWEILFPLLRSVHHMSVTSSREEVSILCLQLTPVFGHAA